jgi:hypothetical protein
MGPLGVASIALGFAFLFMAAGVLNVNFDGAGSARRSEIGASAGLAMGC